MDQGASEHTPWVADHFSKVAAARMGHVEHNRRRYDHDWVDLSKGQERAKITCTAPLWPVAKKLPMTWKYLGRSTPYKSYHQDHLSVIPEGCTKCYGDCVGDKDHFGTCACTDELKGEFAYSAKEEHGVLTPKFLERAVEENGACANVDLAPSRAGSKTYEELCVYCKDRRNCSHKQHLARRERSCDGHVKRTLIKECGIKCGCGPQCRNRVVQHGITRPLEVFHQPVFGWSLRTVAAIPAGAFVLEYAGEVMTTNEMYDRNATRDRNSKSQVSYALNLDGDYLAEGAVDDKHALVVDSTYLGNVARFINHACLPKANLIDVPVEFDNANRNYYHVAFFASRAIAAKEELTWDYGQSFNSQDAQGATVKGLFTCRCGSPQCRGNLGTGAEEAPSSNETDVSARKKGEGKHSAEGGGSEVWRETSKESTSGGERRLKKERKRRRRSARKEMEESEEEESM